MIRAILILLFLLFTSQSVFAVHPFSDVPVGSPYYDAVDTLYNNRILLDDGTGLFRPQAFIGRDAFVGFSVSVACKACLTPSMDDLVRYQISPFPDLRKENPYYYCIAYAKDQDIVQGYILDQNSRTQCQDGTEFTVSPFCERNNTTRIEAVAMLLRQAKLWDDTKNSTPTKRITITDVTDYWYGYAQKGIESGLITLVGTKVLPDEYITRGEFAVMAAKILKYNQCLPSDGTYSIASSIMVESTTGNRIDRTTFTRDERFSLVGVIDTSGATLSGITQNAVYRWTAVNATTGARVTYEGERLPSNLLSPGNWYISMDVVDRRSGNVMTRSSTTLTIGDGSPASGNTGNGNSGNSGGGGIVIGDGWGGSGGGTNNTPPPSAIAQATVSGVVMPSVILSADTLTPSIGANVGFDVTSLGVGPLTYSWNYGDGSRATTSTTLSGTSGGTTTHTYSTPGTYTVTVMMTDGNGRTVQSSVVISVMGKKDSDGDGVTDGNDRCPGVAGTSANYGCPSITSLLGNIEKNACLMSKIQNEGLLVISPVCDSCPCPNSVSFGDGIRSCDVIFPAILSLDLKSIYSRGSLFQVK